MRMPRVQEDEQMADMLDIRDMADIRDIEDISNIADIEDIEDIDELAVLGGEMLLTVAVEAAGRRVDHFLAAERGDISRSRWQKLIKDGMVLVNGRKVKPNLLLDGGESISVTLPEVEELAVEAEDIPLDVIYEDSDIIVVNKPRGMVVHPAVGNYSGTLVNALLGRCKDLSGINGVLRPGIVHRLDKDTTGLIIAAKSDRAHRGLAESWHTGAVNRWYKALLVGSMAEPKGTIDAPIGRHPKERKKMAVVPVGGRHAVTHYNVLERPGRYTLVCCKLETGRTHQIRVHMKYLGYPLVGDPVYGSRISNRMKVGMLLHSAKLDLIHPVTGERLILEAPLPEDFEQFLEEARRGER